jgi:putative membrane protein
MQLPSLAVDMTPEIQAFANGFPTTLAHAGVTLLLLIAGALLHAMLSPHHEIREIRDGNGAAAVSYGGVLIGLAVPLAVSLTASTSLQELAIWGGAVTLVQLLVFRIVDMVLRGLPHRVEEGEIPAAVLLTAAKLSCSLILASAVAG